MSDHNVSITPRDQLVVYSMPSSRANTPVQSHSSDRPNPQKPKASTMYLQSFLKHLKQEYWSYVALAGLTCLYTGVMVAVFGFSDIVDPSKGQIEWFGIFLILTGVGLILASMILYHRKVRRLRPCICCGVDEDDSLEPPPRNKKRLRFAPNLISPYYEIAREKEKTMMMKTQSPFVERSEILTTPIQVIGDETEMMESEERRAETSDGSSAALITTQNNGTKVTMC